MSSRLLMDSCIVTGRERRGFSVLLAKARLRSLYWCVLFKRFRRPKGSETRPKVAI